jgi:hypothetical protein
MFIALILGGILYLPYLMAGINPFAMWVGPGRCNIYE